MTSESVKLAKIRRQSELQADLIRLLNNPVIELIGGVTAIQALYNAQVFGNTTGKIGYNFWTNPRPGVSPDAEAEMAAKIRDHTKTALYVLLIAQQLAPIMPQIAQLGESAINAGTSLIKPAAGQLAGVIGR